VEEIREVHFVQTVTSDSVPLVTVDGVTVDSAQHVHLVVAADVLLE
jgi:hypothetical protein